MNNIIRCLPHATKLLQVQHCFLCIEEENDWFFWSLQLMRDYGWRNFARAQNNKNLAEIESCWPRVCKLWAMVFLGANFHHLATKRMECNPHKVFVWKYFCAPKNDPKLQKFEEYFSPMYFEANILYNGLCHNIPALFTSWDWLWLLS